MSTITPINPLFTPAIDTIADLLERLGDIPADRVWFNPPPGTATEADVLYADDHLNRLCELVDGTLVQKAMGNRESFIAVVIASILRSYIAPRKLGFIFGADGMFRMNPKQVRLPDVAFVSRGRWPNGLPKDPIGDVAPNLVVEVLSKSNTLKEMTRKRAEYFASGVELVWIVDPQTRTVDAYSAAEDFKRHFPNDMLDGGAVLPGFSVQVSEFFVDLDLYSK